MTPEATLIDARGMMCPRPIVELAKARRRTAVGSTIEIIADDLAFESDLRAWCDSTGSNLVDLKRDGEIVTAKIVLTNPVSR